MPLFHRAAVLIALVLMSFSLAGCGSISSFLAGGMADLIPAWAGGLPPDAPPRPGTPQYDALIKQREEKMVVPAAKPGPDPATSPSASVIR
ncbi:hypothetical protein [Tardiphaga sp.]|uniref:hypothetical protein n=1 Tax=Tardiphaga sp. TaxID=1926292 RepID=UPI00260BDE38|nr:hypothetical protein [Tardiphaga sp.]MDB5617094.1 hypothetical protein [Tardiphaga sp.]